MNEEQHHDDLEKIHRESYGWALNCCLRNPTEAENVLQTVYLKVLEGKAKFDGRSSFKTWLFSVIRRTAAEERRRNWLYRLGLKKNEKNLVQGPRRENPDEAIYRSQIQIIFRQALTSLPRRQQEVLQLVFYHDLSLAEAACVMEISLGAARKHYDRSKSRLRKHMEESGGFDEEKFGREEGKKAIS